MINFSVMPSSKVSDTVVDPKNASCAGKKNDECQWRKNKDDEIAEMKEAIKTWDIYGIATLIQKQWEINSKLPNNPKSISQSFCTRDDFL
jgi:hypothetical protein